MQLEHQKQFALLAIQLGIVDKEGLQPHLTVSEGVPLSRRLLDRGVIDVAQRDRIYQMMREERLTADPDADQKEADKKVAQLAVQQQMVDGATLTRCKTAYKQLLEQGQFRPLLQLMVEQGAITKEQARQLSALQSREIYGCPVCGTQMARAAIQPGTDCHCCGAPFGAAQASTLLFDAATVYAPPPRHIEAAPEPSDDPFVGAKLGYVQIARQLGQGAMGSVYLGRHETLDIDVAVKVLPHALAVHEQTRQRFLREAQAAAKLSHANVVRVMDVRQHEMTHFLVMEYVEGGSVQDRLDEEGQLPIKEAIRIAREAATGIQAAHKAGLVHRDIKPANLLLTPGGQVKVADFGLARAHDSRLSTAGQLMGTPGFMPPEQAHGKEELDHRCDIYALGVTLYVMLTNEVPFLASNAMATVMRSLNEPMPSARERNPDVGPALDALIQTLCAKKAEDRPDTMEAVGDALKVVLETDRPARASKRMKESHIQNVQAVKAKPAPSQTGGYARTGKPARPRRQSSSGVRKLSSGRLDRVGSSRRRQQSYAPLFAACAGLIATVLLIMLVAGMGGDGEPDPIDEGQDKPKKSQPDPKKPTPQPLPKKQPPKKQAAGDSQERHRALMAALQGVEDPVKKLALLAAYLEQPAQGDPRRMEVQQLHDRIASALQFQRGHRQVRQLLEAGNTEDARKLARLLVTGGDPQRERLKRTLLETIDRSNRAPRLLEQGMEQANRGQYDKALVLFEQAIKIAPGMAEAYAKRGRVRLAKLELQEAQKDFHRALQRSPELAEAHIYLGACLLAGQQYEQALKHLDSGIRFKPPQKADLKQAYVFRGRIHHLVGKYAKALADFNSAMQLFPYDVVPYFHRANLHLHRKNFTDAISDYQRVTQLAKSYYAAYVGLGRAYAGSGDKALALKTLQRARELAPASAHARIDQLIEAVKQGGY